MARLRPEPTTARASPRFGRLFGIPVAGRGLGAIVAVAVEVMVQVRVLLPQRLILLQQALQEADERHDKRHDSRQTALIGRRDIIPVKVVEIDAKPFQHRGRWFDRRRFRRGCRHFQSLPCISITKTYITQQLEGPEVFGKYFSLYGGDSR